MKSKKIMVLLLLLILAMLTGCAKKSYGVSDYKIEMEYKDNFKICQLTDIHWGIEMDYEYETEHLTKVINAMDNPDLIVITGDSFLFGNKAMVKKFVQFFDSFKIPWTYTYGNHDQQGTYDYYYINKEIKKSEYAKFVDYKDDNLSGLTNFYINLTKDGNTVYRLYIVDSGCYQNEGLTYGYGIIEEDQLTHLKAISAYENDNAPGLMFIHIPLYEYDIISVGETIDSSVGFGDKEEKSCPGYTNLGQYDVFKEINVKAVMCGHDHINDYTVNYNNEMILSYGVKATDLVYHDDEMIGYKEIILPSDTNNFGLSSFKNVMVPYDEK